MEPNLDLESSSTPVQASLSSLSATASSTTLSASAPSSSSITCAICGKILSSRISVARHMRNIPEKVRSNILVTIQFSFMFLFC